MTREQDALKLLQDFAFNILRQTIKYSGKSGDFKCQMTLAINGEEKPVLLLGTAHGLPFEDGYAIAILNPDATLIGGIRAGTSYTSGALKATVSGKCDAMVHLWLDAYKSKEAGEALLDSYLAREPKPAKYEVR